MKKTIKNSALALTLGLSCAAAVAGFVGFNVSAENTLTTTDSVFCDGASFRYTTDAADTTGNGLRLQVGMATEYYNGLAAEDKTYTLVIPNDLLNGAALTVNTANVEKQETTGGWGKYTDEKTSETYMRSLVYLWDIPENSYNREIAYRGVVEKADGTLIYATETETRSLASVAKTLYTSDDPAVTEAVKTAAAAYIKDYTVTFDNNGNTTTEEVTYGDAIAALPTAATKAGFTFAGWYNGDTLWNADDVVTENVTLTAKYTDNDATVEEGTFSFSGLSMTVALDKENVYGDSDTAVKVTTTSGQYKTDEGSLNSQTLFGNLEIGDTITYYLKALNLQTSSTQNGTYSDVTTLGMNKLLNPVGFDAQGTFPGEILKADGSVAIYSGKGFMVENVITVGEWYKVTYVATANTFKNFSQKCGKIHMFQYGINQFVKGEWVIDGITVTKGSDLENTVWEGEIGIDGLNMSVAKTTDTYTGSGTAIKVTTTSGTYKTCSGTMTSANLYGTLTVGQTVTYYIKATNVKTSTTKDGVKTDASTVLVKQLLNPASWDAQLPSSVTKADGTAVATEITGNEELTVGEWYKVTYTTTGKANDSGNTTFKGIGTSSGMACWMQYGHTIFMQADWIIDGITIS